MPDELVFTVEGSKATLVERVILPEIGFTERADLVLPLRDVEEFTVVPRGAASTSGSDQLPVVPWPSADFVRLNEVTPNRTNLCAVESRFLAARHCRGSRLRCLRDRKDPPPFRTDLAGLATIFKRRFGRRNWPFTAAWAAGGDQQMYYRMDADVADPWIEAATSLGLREEPTDSMGGPQGTQELPSKPLSLDPPIDLGR